MWLRAQEFDYAALDSVKIIDTLAGAADIKKSFWRSVSGSILVQDCVEDDGSMVERHFDLYLSRSGDGPRLIITLRASRPNQTMQPTAGRSDT